MRKKYLDNEQRLAKELFSQMDRKEKAKYILQYYGIHIFVTIALIIGVIVYIGEYRANKEREDWLYFVAPNAYTYELEVPINALAQENNWPEGINHLVYSNDDLEGGYGNMQLMAYLTNDEVDFLVCDEMMLILLQEDETLKFDAVELEQTVLGQSLEFKRKLYVVTFYDTARYDKVMAFRALMIPEQESGQSA